MSSITERADFTFIRYANVWEDADVLLQALGDMRDKKILSIASAGDNSFSLLTLDPSLVVAVDVNEVQLWLVELKRELIRQHKREEAIAFLGFTESHDRWSTFQKIRPSLSASAADFFDTQREHIEKGIIHAGKFERYFQMFSKRILPLIHRRSTVLELMRPKDQEAQASFYHDRWNTWRWRLLFNVFFSKFVMGRFGRDPEFLEEVKVPVSKFIFLQAEKHLMSVGSQRNYILRYNLTGSFGDLLPHYLQEENYEMIKSRLDRMVLYKGYAEAAIAEHGPFDGMNLSNIFEYMPPDVFKSVASGLVNGLQSQGRMAYWNLMVPRKMHRVVESLVYQRETSASLKAIDKGFFYQGIVIEEKI